MDEETPCEAESRTRGSHINPNQRMWKNKVEYVLSLAGYTTGSSDFWRFPYLIWRHGGGTFIFAYIISAVVIAIPVYYLEVAVSQFSGRGMFDVWDISPIMKGLGIGMFLINMEYLILEPIFRLWIIEYIGYSCMSPLPWKRCDNPWNTPACVDFYNIPSGKMNSTLNETQAGMSAYNLSSAVLNTQQVLAEEEFFLHKILQVSGSVYDLGTLRWDLCLCLLVFTSVCTACVIKSVDSIGKAMYVLTFLPIVLLLIIWIRTLIAPGAVAGMQYFLTPDFNKFGKVEISGKQILAACSIKGTSVVKFRTVFRWMNKYKNGKVDVKEDTRPGGPGVEASKKNIAAIIKDGGGYTVSGIAYLLWVQAGYTAAFSLCTATGGNMEISSRANFRTNVLSASIIPCVMDIFGSIFTSMVVYSVIGVMAHESGMQLGETLFSGNSAAFVAFSRAFSFFPLPNLWLVLFFVAFLVATSDITIFYYEILNRYLQKVVPCLQSRPKTAFAAMFVISFLLNLPFCTQAGAYFYQIAAWYAASWGVFVMATLECVIFMWIYGGHMLDGNIKMMNGTKMPHIIRFTAAFVCPVLFIVFLVLGIARYKPPVFGTYHYPSSIEGIGICIGILPVVPLVYWIMLSLYRNRGTGFTKEGLTKLFRPNDRWGPRDSEYVDEYSELVVKQTSWTNRVYYNVNGRQRKITRPDEHDQSYVMTKMI